jgi:DNA polymerase V
MKIVALIDCNNFFVSCERAFNPSLEKVPVIVLSNNDGCVISRSDEAKKLGINMDPYFKIKDFCHKNNVRVFSSNFPLYGDMSSRIMSILQDFSPEIEVYSIDEAFISLSHVPSNRVFDYASDIRKSIFKETGITVSIGISSTKTLAKIAQSVARKNSLGVYDLRDSDSQNRILELTDVSDIWGVGKNLTQTLRDLNIYNAKQFRDADTGIIRKYLKLTGQKLQHELKAIECFELEQIQEKRKNIAVSRSFSCNVTDKEELEYIISEFAATAAAKLRKQESNASALQVYFRTAKHTSSPLIISGTENLLFSTSDTSLIIESAKYILNKIFREGYKYRKAGIILMNLTDSSNKQKTLYDNEKNPPNLLKTIDEINSKIGKNKIFFLAQGINKRWVGKRELISQEYTTNWKELPKVV